ncbi:MAG TPA: hypothetical protein PLX50_10200 [Candidatus Aminicenantes bacterium]|nr:hypothetical protein [Candidatus Aminicenantes bacterium]
MKKIRAGCLLMMAAAFLSCPEAWPVSPAEGWGAASDVRANRSSGGRPASAAAGLETAARDGKREFGSPGPAAGERTAPQEKKPAGAGGGDKKAGPVVPAYSDIKQKSAVAVFYVWLWLSIAVLTYLLRLWIIEADRVYISKYYDPEESPRKDNPLAPTLGE